MKGTDKFKETIKAYLDNLAETSDFALSYAKPDKNIDECIDYILTQVKGSGCAGFDDAEIFGMAVHYYDEQDPGKISKGLSGNVVVNHHIELTEEEKEAARQQAIKDLVEAEKQKMLNKEKREKEAAKARAEEARKKLESEGVLSLF